MNQLSRSIKNSKLSLEIIGLVILALILFFRFPFKFIFEPPFLMDLNVYRVAAELIRTSQGSLLYSISYSEDMYFRYAPIWALLWSWLGFLSAHQAAVAWTIFSVSWLIFTLYLAGQILRISKIRYPFWASIATLLLLTRPLLGVMGNGQVDLWWGGLICIWLYAELKNKHSIAAIGLALAILLKLPAALFISYFIFMRKWRQLALTLIWTSILLLAGAILTVPSGGFAIINSWITSLAHTAPGPNEALAFSIGSQSLLALVARFTTSDGYGLNLISLSYNWVFIITLLTDILLFTLIVRKHKNQSHKRTVIDTSLLMTLMILASPSAWVSTYSALVFPVFLSVCLLANSFEKKNLTIISTLLAIISGAFNLATHKKFWKFINMPYWKTESYVFLVFMILPLFSISLFVLLLWNRGSAIKQPLTEI